MIGSVMETARNARRNDGEYSKIGWMAKLREMGDEAGCGALLGWFLFCHCEERSDVAIQSICLKIRRNLRTYNL
ncbi:hypothetical protein BIU88_03615 [Chlorobaculum limnaeum]|uniref:Uncharacterized protein n=1 Tax=Chlorobaculum limnaeum TaxID=274537 RepID=A0A1D8D6T2_CHLLM|nr:hypothetical protein [Chlorobaculum limnaeum]AOS83309.1 hypothetical protein BIU88_03615 [Chlorobaculum limnaeum]